jgi:hypothetical protein
MSIMSAELLERVTQIIQTIKLHNLLDLPPEIEIDLEERPAEKKYIVHASTCIIENIIYINPSVVTLDNITDTLCHELVHVEQGWQGRLSYPVDSSDYQWGDQRYQLPKNNKEYRNFPWEKDARKRGSKIARQVQKILKRTGNELPRAGQC